MLSSSQAKQMKPAKPLADHKCTCNRCSRKKSPAINFQNEGRHAMEQNQAVNEGDGVDDGCLVCNMTCRKRSHHYKNLRRHGWSMPLDKKC